MATLLAGLAFFAVAHGFDGAGGFFCGGVGLGGTSGSGGDGGLFDVAGLEGS